MPSVASCKATRPAAWADRRYFQPEIETMPRARIEELQLAALKELLSSTIDASPLYRRLWHDVPVEQISSLDDFKERVPLLDKSDLVAYRDETGDMFCGALSIDLGRIDMMGTTSGTTSEPMPLIELFDRNPPNSPMIRDLWGAGVRPGDRVLHCMAVQRGPQERIYQRLGCIPLMVDMRAGADWSEVFAMMRRHRPTHIYLLAPMVAELNGLSDDYDLRSIFVSVTSAVVTGEPLGRRMRARMVEGWDLDVYSVAGVGDAGVAWDCSAHAGHHIWEDFTIAECLDPVTKREVQEGEVGELVCTSLANVAWPLVRYQSGDLVRMDRSTCACGRTHARYSVVGRKSDRLVIAGATVLPNEVWAVVESQDETAAGLFQILRRASIESSELHVRVGFNPRRTASLPDLSERLTSILQESLGVRSNVGLLPENELMALSPSGVKLPRMVEQ
jgi:phenylacetate-CoA ligase